MDKKLMILAALASSDGVLHTPVQVQKLLFLIDREIPSLVGGPLFDFQPYNYGPFDKAVYSELSTLAEEGEVAIVPQNNWLSYRLTEKGLETGKRILCSLPEQARDYIDRSSQFVRSLPFAELVSAIYAAYPEMRQNSVFQKC
jgi:uncharacterized phage-associated protein